MGRRDNGTHNIFWWARGEASRTPSEYSVALSSPATIPTSICLIPSLSLRPATVLVQVFASHTSHRPLYIIFQSSAATVHVQALNTVVSRLISQSSPAIVQVPHVILSCSVSLPSLTLHIAMAYTFTHSTTVMGQLAHRIARTPPTHDDLTFEYVNS